MTFELGPGAVQVALGIVTLLTVAISGRRGTKSHQSTDEKLDALLEGQERTDVTLAEHGRILEDHGRRLADVESTVNGTPAPPLPPPW